MGGKKVDFVPKGGLEPPFPRPQRGVLTPIRLELPGLLPMVDVRGSGEVRMFGVVCVCVCVCLLCTLLPSCLSVLAWIVG